MRSTQRALNYQTTRGRQPMALPPATRLKAIRVHTQTDGRPRVSAKECLAAYRAYKRRVGKKGRGVKPTSQEGPHPTSWYRYEDAHPKKQGDRPIPHDLIRAIEPLLVGRGSPPITRNQLWTVTEFGRPIDDTFFVPEKPKLTLVKSLTPQKKGAAVPVSFKARRGVLVKRSSLGKKTYGASPFPATTEGQFAVLVVDDHADPVFPPKTVLNCVPEEDIAKTKGKRVVAFAMQIGNDSEGEVLVVNVENVVGYSVILRTLDGVLVDGDILGVVKGHYSQDL